MAGQQVTSVNSGFVGVASGCPGTAAMTLTSVGAAMVMLRAVVMRFGVVTLIVEPVVMRSIWASAGTERPLRCPASAKVPIWPGPRCRGSGRRQRAVARRRRLRRWARPTSGRARDTQSREDAASSAGGFVGTNGVAAGACGVASAPRSQRTAGVALRRARVIAALRLRAGGGRGGRCGRGVGVGGGSGLGPDDRGHRKYGCGGDTHAEDPSGGGRSGSGSGLGGGVVGGVEGIRHVASSRLSGRRMRRGGGAGSHWGSPPPRRPCQVRLGP